MADSSSPASAGSNFVLAWAAVAIALLIGGSYLPANLQFWVALPLAIVSAVFCLALLMRA